MAELAGYAVWVPTLLLVIFRVAGIFLTAPLLSNAAVPAKSMGRLQIGFKNMVDNCRRIIQRWPDSWYAYKAQQMLIDMPERFYPRYKITEEEKDLSRFTKPRPGTKPFTDTDKDSR